MHMGPGGENWNPPIIFIVIITACYGSILSTECGSFGYRGVKTFTCHITHLLLTVT